MYTVNLLTLGSLRITTASSSTKFPSVVGGRCGDASISAQTIAAVVVATVTALEMVTVAAEEEWMSVR